MYERGTFPDSGLSFVWRSLSNRQEERRDRTTLLNQKPACGCWSRLTAAPAVIKRRVVWDASCDTSASFLFQKIFPHFLFFSSPLAWTAYFTYIWLMKGLRWGKDEVMHMGLILACVLHPGSHQLPPSNPSKLNQFLLSDGSCFLCGVGRLLSHGPFRS